MDCSDLKRFSHGQMVNIAYMDGHIDPFGKAWGLCPLALPSIAVNYLQVTWAWREDDPTKNSNPDGKLVSSRSRDLRRSPAESSRGTWHPSMTA